MIMRTLDWRKKNVTVESIRSLSDCEIIVNDRQFETDHFQRVEIIGNSYVSNLAKLFADAKIRNIKFRPPREGE